MSATLGTVKQLQPDLTCEIFERLDVQQQKVRILGIMQNRTFGICGGKLYSRKSDGSIETKKQFKLQNNFEII
jgi:hypothetical protein